MLDHAHIVRHAIAMRTSAKDGPSPPARPEPEIFEDLGRLCISPRYVHAIAYFCFRDNVIRYSGEMKTNDMAQLFSRSRLIRTEISTLVGFMLKGEIDYSLPAPGVMQSYVDKTEALLEELHYALGGSFLEGVDLKAVANGTFDPFSRGSALREPIFYAGESAYNFQYRDLSPKKFARDDEWLRANKGFSIREARDVVYAVEKTLNDKSIQNLDDMRATHPDRWTYLPGFMFSSQEVASRAQMGVAVVEKVLETFTVPGDERNTGFRALNDFNVVSASPLLRGPDSTYVLFEGYNLVEALYDAPFYWMGVDAAYVSTAMRHRGKFAEEFAAERLAHVFGADKVFINVDIFESKSKKVGEIDVLVLFGNRAIVLQAKSKRLTLEARRGNDGQIRDDFKKSVQDAYDQAHTCASLLGNAGYVLKDALSREIAIPNTLKAKYVLCLVSDHYPALSFQVRQFLKFQSTEKIPPPFVLDVFSLDAMTEILDTPLQLLSYIDRRTKYFDRFMASHELTILSYHLKQNLWLDGEYNLVVLDDTLSADLDLAMLVRREGIQGARTPDGILTRFVATRLGKFVKEIEARPDPATIDLGFMLLTLGEDTVKDVSEAVDELANRARRDGKSHDVTLTLGESEAGFTVHCNNDPIPIAGPRLQNHCHVRKYIQKAATWFGVCVRPSDTSLRFGINLDYKWERSDKMDAATRGMAASRSGNLRELLKTPGPKKAKTGRNDPCPCGSGKKYKKCCGRTF